MEALTLERAELADGRVLSAAPDARLLLDGEPVASFDAAPTRDEWHTPWGGPPEVRSIDVSPDGVVFVNVHVGGILRSDDGGQTWAPTIDLHADVHQVLALDDGVVLAACGDGGLAVSRDGGTTWRMCTDGLQATYCRAVAVRGKDVYASASRGPRGNGSAVYRKPLDDDDAAFEVVVDRLTNNVDSGCLVVDDDGAVWYSTDRRSWQRIEA